MCRTTLCKLIAGCGVMAMPSAEWPVLGVASGRHVAASVEGDSADETVIAVAAYCELAVLLAAGHAGPEARGDDFERCGVRAPIMMLRVFAHAKMVLASVVASGAVAAAEEDRAMRPRQRRIAQRTASIVTAAAPPPPTARRSAVGSPAGGANGGGDGGEGGGVGGGGSGGEEGGGGEGGGGDGAKMSLDSSEAVGSAIRVMLFANQTCCMVARGVVKMTRAMEAAALVLFVRKRAPTPTLLASRRRRRRASGPAAATCACTWGGRVGGEGVSERDSSISREQTVVRIRIWLHDMRMLCGCGVRRTWCATAVRVVCRVSCVVRVGSALGTPRSSVQRGHKMCGWSRAAWCVYARKRDAQEKVQADSHFFASTFVYLDCAYLDCDLDDAALRCKNPLEPRNKVL